MMENSAGARNSRRNVADYENQDTCWREEDILLLG